MCATCGCSPTTHGHGHGHGHGPRSTAHEHEHEHGHGHGPRSTAHEHEHEHPHAPSARRVLDLERSLLAHNDRFAAANRRFLAARDILALNLLSSPGSGKTTLLCETLRRLLPHRPAAVIEGDQQTSLDADRIRAAGAPAIQLNTGRGCHLEAHGVGHALDDLASAAALVPGSVLFIENVGNLVCPALFDLGEAHKVVLLSVTEGDDKPLKYPDMFAAADLVLISKIDLLPYVQFDVERCLASARLVNPTLTALSVSAQTGAGMDAWLGWLAAARAPATPQPPAP